MNKQEAKEFLEIVKGRKIKLDYWDEGEYTIPTGEWKNTSDNDPTYWSFWGIDEDGDRDYWHIDNGFEETSYSNNWEFVETFDDYLEMYYSD